MLYIPHLNLGKNLYKNIHLKVWSLWQINGQTIDHQNMIFSFDDHNIRNINRVIMLFLYEQYLSLSTIVFMICTDQRKTVGIKRIPPVFFIPNRNTSFIVMDLLGFDCQNKGFYIFMVYWVKNSLWYRRSKLFIHNNSPP